MHMHVRSALSPCAALQHTLQLTITAKSGTLTSSTRKWAMAWGTHEEVWAFRHPAFPSLRCVVSVIYLSLINFSYIFHGRSPLERFLRVFPRSPSIDTAIWNWSAPSTFRAHSLKWDSQPHRQKIQTQQLNASFAIGHFTKKNENNVCEFHGKFKWQVGSGPEVSGEVCMLSPA